MVALLAQLRTDSPILDERSSARRTLRLQVPTGYAQNATEAWIHNLSETGLLLETGAGLEVGEELQVELPHSGPTAAVVIWVRGNFAGCEFAAPVSRAAVSAALLRAPPESASPAIAVAPPWSRHAPAERDELDEVEDQDANPVIVIASLLVGLAVATLLVVALLTFPFALS